jgi:hypothetical protein
MSWSKVKSDLLAGKPLAVEVQSSDPNLKAWIGIYRLEPGRGPPGFLRRLGVGVTETADVWHLRYFELLATDQAESGQRWLCEEDLLNTQSWAARSVDEVIADLERRGIRPEEVKRHDECDYPI